MRPLELTLEGFKSYRIPRTFNFESRTLFGIVGPTGSGKSSILEGIIFGLYGKTPSVESGSKRLINSQDAQARVQLIFEVDDVVWEVNRIIRVKGISETVLRRLDAVGEPFIGDRVVTDKIVEIVGLDFESFRSSVSLPQGEFDRFLKAAPTERSRILKGIFRLDRVDNLRDAARSRLQVIEGQIGVLRKTLEGFPEQPELLLEQLQADAKTAQRLHDEVKEALPKVLEAEREVERSIDELGRVESSRTATRAALDRLPPEESLRDLSDRQLFAERRLEESVAALADSSAELAAAETEESEVLLKTGGEAWLAQVESGLNDRKRLVQAWEVAQVSMKELEVVLAEKAAALPGARVAFEAAEGRLAAASAQLRHLQQQHAAHLLRGELEAGHPCPVCEQTVSAIPDSPRLPALSQAETELAQAEKDMKFARSSLDAADRDHSLAEERLRLAAGGAEQRRVELDGVEQLLEELAPGVADPAAEVAARRTALATARARLQKARTGHHSADAEERKSRAQLESLGQKTRDLTTLLIHTCGLLGIEPESMSGEGLWDSAKRVIEAGESRIEELLRRRADLEATARDSRQIVMGFRIRFNAAEEDHSSDVLARVKGEVTKLEMKIEELRSGMSRRRETESELAGLTERKGRFDRLIADFADSKFTAYLLDEQRRLLSRIGSEKFHELTGHYTFDELGQFQIVDQRNGQTRSPDTLSGGETFLASLSLALALSEAVALEGGRLGCFFLDEGFGSLDQESLDLALDGIESLAVPGRLIGLISHVPGVQGRLDDLIILERLADGSTDVAQHEGPFGFASALV